MTNSAVEDDKNRSVGTDHQHHQHPPPFQGVSNSIYPPPPQQKPTTGFPQPAQPYVSANGDLGLPNQVEQDATMTEPGDKFRPPGDPPNARVSWAQKVSGGNIGGRLNPENIIDETFVNERLSLTFPHGEDGEPVINIGMEVLEAMNGLWKGVSMCES